MKIKFLILFLSSFIAVFTCFSQVKLYSILNANLFNNGLLDTSQKTKSTVSPSMLVSPSFYSNNLAFFCRQEIKFEKATKIPFKFRLGSVQQVDYLEGKRVPLLP